MKIYIVFGITILLFFAAPACGSDHAPSASIQVTATVAQPVGLVDAQQVGDALASPIVTQCSSRWFLYVPRECNMLVQLDGQLLDTGAGHGPDIITVLDLTEIPTPSSDSLTLTLIYSEN